MAGTNRGQPIMELEIGTDFSGVGSVLQALKRLHVPYREVFACDSDKFARLTYTHNYGTNFAYPDDVYKRDIPGRPLDLYVTTPPCQGFSNAGKRAGSILFYNSLDFIRKNKPAAFVFENVRGLLTHDGGRTFGTWVELLGGLSVNGNEVIFPHPEAVPYHIFYKVLNATEFNIPQNRERIFIVGFRKSVAFTWPRPHHLTKTIADVLDENPPAKYWLTEKFIKSSLAHKDRHEAKGNGFAFQPKYITEIASTIQTKYGCRPTDTFIYQMARGFNEGGAHDICPTVTSNNWQNNNFPIIAGTVRKFTPREVFRLMDYPDTFDFSPVSDNQAYKQAGNSIPVGMIGGVISKMLPFL